MSKWTKVIIAEDNNQVNSGNIATYSNIGRMLLKSGFVRNKEKDFSDDGSRFYCYMYNDIPCFLCKSDGLIYLTVKVNNMYELPYNIYSKLPHYESTEKYNMCEKVDINDFIQIITAYQKEVDEELDKIKNADYDFQPIIDRLNHEKQHIEDDLNYCKQNITLDFLDDLESQYDKKNILDYFNSIRRNYKQIINKLNDYQNGNISNNDIARDLNKVESQKYLIYEDDDDSSFYIKEIVNKVNNGNKGE